MTSKALKLNNKINFKILGLYVCHDYNIDSFKKDLKKFIK